MTNYILYPLETYNYDLQNGCIEYRVITINDTWNDGEGRAIALSWTAVGSESYHLVSCPPWQITSLPWTYSSNVNSRAMFSINWFKGLMGVYFRIICWVGGHCRNVAANASTCIKGLALAHMVLWKSMTKGNRCNQTATRHHTGVLWKYLWSIRSGLQLPSCHSMLDK